MAFLSCVCTLEHVSGQRAALYDLILLSDGVGDAAHAMTTHAGRGANTAFEDALLLSETILGTAAPATAVGCARCGLLCGSVYKRAESFFRSAAKRRTVFSLPIQVVVLTRVVISFWSACSLCERGHIC
jgi:hypothetical protein